MARSRLLSRCVVWSLVSKRRCRGERAADCEPAEDEAGPVTLGVVGETAGAEGRLVAEEFVVCCLENEQGALAQANCGRRPCDVLLNVAAQIVAWREAEAEVHGCVPLRVEKHLGAKALRVLLTGVCGARLPCRARQHSPCVLDCVVVVVSSCNSEHTK
jgi:hypothetical protein